MNIATLSQIMNFCKKNSEKGKVKHFTFLLNRNKIVSVGKNNREKTHPKAFKLGYWVPSIHSELDAILKFPHPPKKLRKVSVVNIRVTRDGKIGMSKPCAKCQVLLRSFGINEAIHSTDEGEMVCSSF